MPLLQLVASEGKWVDGPIRFRYLSAGEEAHLPISTQHMPEANTSPAGSHRSQDQVVETAVLLTIRHTKPLPLDWQEKVLRRIYDYAAIGGNQVDVSAKEWYALEVKEV